MNPKDFVPLINGESHSWGDITAIIGGVPMIGITGIEYGEKQEMKNHYGAGRYPISRSKGRVEPFAKIVLAMEEVLGLQRQSITGRLQDIAPFPIIVTYLPEDGDIVVDKILACQFPQNSRKWKEGDTRQEVDLDLVVAAIVWDKNKKQKKG